jgi:hypothetical protein
MAKYSPPAVTEVFWVTTVTSYNTITSTEINAGADLSTFVRNMPDLPRTANLVDVATIDSKFEKRQVGTRGGDVASLEILRDDSADTAYTTLSEDTVGYLVLGRAGWTTAGTSGVGDVVDVFPATVASSEDGTPGRNDPDFAVIQLAITDTPNRGFTLTA